MGGSVSREASAGFCHKERFSRPWVCANELPMVPHALRPHAMILVLAMQIRGEPGAEPQGKGRFPGWRGSGGWQCPNPLLLIGKSAGVEPEPSSNCSNARETTHEDKPSHPQMAVLGPWRPPHRAHTGRRRETPAVGPHQKVGGAGLAAGGQ